MLPNKILPLLCISTCVLASVMVELSMKDVYNLFRHCSITRYYYKIDNISSYHTFYSEESTPGGIYKRNAFPGSSSWLGPVFFKHVTIDPEATFSREEDDDYSQTIRNLGDVSLLRYKFSDCIVHVVERPFLEYFILSSNKAEVVTPGFVVFLMQNRDDPLPYFVRDWETHHLNKYSILTEFYRPTIFLEVVHLSNEVSYICIPCVAKDQVVENIRWNFHHI